MDETNIRSSLNLTRNWSSPACARVLTFLMNIAPFIQIDPLTGALAGIAILYSIYALYYTRRQALTVFDPSHSNGMTCFTTPLKPQMRISPERKHARQVESIPPGKKTTGNPTWVSNLHRSARSLANSNLFQ